MTIVSVSKRPSELVAGYLRQAYQDDGVLHGEKLPTLSGLAKALGVSGSTVQGVIGEWVKAGRLRSERGRGIYWVKPEKLVETKVVTINLSQRQMRLDTVWAGLISLGVMETFAKFEGEILLRPSRFSEIETAGKSAYAAEAENSDGAILFTRRGCMDYVHAFQQVGKPVITINPDAPTATRNFVSTDYFRNGYLLGRTWGELKRKRIGLVLQNWPGESVAWMLLLLGFKAGLEFSGHPEATLNYYVVSSPENVRDEKMFADLCQLFNGIPDALYFVSPVLALRAIRVFQAKHIQVPCDVSIVSGTADEDRDPTIKGLSLFSQSLKEIGHQAAEMMIKRLTLPEYEAPGEYLGCHYVTGSSTTLQENERILELIAEKLPEVSCP